MTNSRFANRLASQVKLVADYCAPTAKGGYSIPIDNFGNTLFWAVHAKYPKYTYVSNISSVMRVSSFFPDLLVDYMTRFLSL